MASEVTLRRRLQAIDDYEFENFVADLWRRRGYDATVSNGSRDMGVDIEAFDTSGPFDRKEVIQAKRYSEGNKVGRPKIQQYHTLKEQDAEADMAVVVTTSEFTRTAEDWADEHNVKLVDGDGLVELVEEIGAHDLVDRYAPAEIPREEPAPEPEPVSESTTSATDSEIDNRYVAVIALALVGQGLAIFAVATPGFLPVLSDNAATWLGVLLWFVIPPAVFLDAVTLHRNGAAKRPNRIVWPVATFMFPIVAPAYYLLARA